MEETSKSPIGWLKMNFDAAINNESAKMGSGNVLCNESGNFIATRAIPWKGIYTLKEAESLAVSEALSWIKIKSFDFVQVKTDLIGTGYAWP